MSANVEMIQIAATALAAGLADADDLKQGHGLNAEERALAEGLAAAEPDNVYAIAPREHPEVLAIKLDMAARLIGMRLTTLERFTAACLAERDDADDLAAVIEAQASTYGAPAPSRAEPWKNLLPADGGGVLPRAGKISDLTRTRPDGPTGANPLCVRGRHTPGPIDDNGWATCTACGTGLVTVLPGGPVYFEGGNAPVNVL